MVGSSTTKKDQRLNQQLYCLIVYQRQQINQQTEYITLMKGTVSVNPLFQSADIPQSHVFNVQPLIASDSHRLYFRNNQNSYKWEHKSIINCCFTEKYAALIILSQEGKLHIFTQTLDEIARIPWQSKYSVGLEFLDKKNMFLMIGATDVEIQYVKIYSNIKSTKFVSSMNFGIEKKDKYIVDPDTKLQWNKGYNYDLQENLLYLWSSKDINFYYLDNLTLKCRITSLTRKDLSITYVLYIHNYKYTVTGLINGQIKVWRLPQNSTNCTPKDYILIHKYVRHSKQVDKIVQGADERVIISSSEQLVICLWSLETFQMLRQYDFLAEYSKIFIHNSIYSLAIKDGQLGKLKFGKTMQFITEITSQVVCIQKYRKNPTISLNESIGSVQITLSSNLGFQIRDDQLDSQDLNKIQLQFIYPPLKAKGINQILANPFVFNQYFLLVENGEIFRLRIENNSGKIQQSYSLEKTKDVQQHQLNQSPTVIKFLTIVPPQFDSQINENSIQKKSRMANDYQSQYVNLKLITIGCSKGTIVFLKTDNFQLIYTRVTYHRQAITALDSFSHNNQQYLISCCQELFLKIIKFDHQKAICIQSVYIADTISILKGLEDRFAIFFKKGCFQIFKLDENEKQYSLRNKTEDHDDDIISIDSDPVRKLIMTSGLDNKIKIWSYEKVLVYEIIMDQGLQNAIWFRPFQILIVHNLKILYFKNIGLKITSNQINDANELFIQNHEQEKINIQEAVKIVKSFKNDTKFQMIEQADNRISGFKTKDTKNVRTNRSFEITERTLQNPKPTPKKLERSSKQIIVDDPQKKVSQQKKRKVLAKNLDETKMTQKQLDAFRKHIDEINEIRKQTNQTILPKIKPKNQDAFDNFMKSKLINKKILTRRDITLNRIIMKNIIKEHFGNDNQITNNLKLDF